MQGLKRNEQQLNEENKASPNEEKGGIMQGNPMHPLKWLCIWDINLLQTAWADLVHWVKLKWKIELQLWDHRGSQRPSTAQKLPIHIPVLS